MIKVKIKKQAKAKTGYQVDGSLYNDPATAGGADYNSNMGQPKLRESRYITADPREESNVEAEGGEIVYGDINGDNFPEAQIIKGPRHAQGGVPLNLPEDTFIYSDTRTMRIKDCEILQMFGKACGKKSYTPAELAKQYDINKYRVILEDPNSDAIDRKTAEIMIKKYVIKLGCLALKQESMKGFPQGIPAVAIPCMEMKGITEEQILPNQELTVLNDQLDKLNQSQEQGSNENMVEQAMGMNQGNPVAEPMQQQPPQLMQPAPPQQGMMGYGGYKAQYGMEQPSPDQMAMQQQDPQQQMMMQIMSEVQAALEQGNPPEQIIESLLANEIDPQTIAQMFIQLGMPQEEVIALVESVISPQQPPMTQEQMMQAPMAMYGLNMGGGSDMPFYDIPEAEYGMNVEANPTSYQDGGLPMAGNGITIKESDYATPEELNLALRKAYLKSRRTGEKIYVTRADGKTYEQRVSAGLHKTYTGSDLPEWNNNQVAAATFEAMAQTFNDLKVKAAFANRVRTVLQDQENYKGKTRYDAAGNPLPPKYSKKYRDRFGIDPSDPNALTDDQIVEQYLRMQERNLKTTTYKDKLGLPMFGSWMYKDADGNLRDFNSTGDKKGDKLGFKDLIKQQDPNMSDAEIQQMYDKIKNSGMTSLKAISTDMGIPMDWGAGQTDMNREAYLQQAGFIAANQLMKDIEANPDNYDEETQLGLLGITKMAGFQPYGVQVGFSDETGMGEMNISPIDAYYNNTSQGQIQGHHTVDFTDIPINELDCQCEDETAANYSPYKDANGNCTCNPPIDQKKCPCTYSDGSTVMLTPDASGNCPPCEEEQNVNVPGGYAPWWLQDTIKTTGAFGDLMGLKKYMPWAPGVDLETPRPTFLDPTRELAANAEQANIQTQGMAQFAGPQALSSRSSGIQGQAAKNAADVLSKYNNANVNIANEFELKATDIRNKESMLKQATSQRLYDQNTVANQQFDNAKLAMRNNLRNYYTNAITNRWQTDALNQMYPDYAVDPSVGGQMHHTPNYRKPTPTSGGMTFQEAFEWCKNNGDNNPSACAQRMLSQQGKSSQTMAADPNMVGTMYGNQYSKYGGAVKPKSGYVYYNPWFDDDM